jgi:hypothetical protein
MKTGIIVYVVGDDIVKDATDLEKEIRKMELEADKIEIISRASGHFDVSDAWWALTARGMNRIFCVIGESTASGNVRLTGRMLRLCG